MYHGPHCELARRAFGIEEDVTPFDCIQWNEALIPHGWSTVAYRGGTPIGTYIQTGLRAIIETRLGAGRVLSFGFQYGYAYSRSTMPIVPPACGRREMHPIVLLKESPVAVLAGRAPNLPIVPAKGVEIARFGDRLIVVNHRASPVRIDASPAHRAIPQIPAAPGWLAAHSATCLEF
jgi:hypothetical protein